MNDLTSFQDNNPRGAGRRAERPIFQRPDEVLNDPNMSRAEKRTLLASWASDARAVADAPSMRELHDGSIVEVDEILRALKALDANDIFTVPSAGQMGRGVSGRRDEVGCWSCEHGRESYVAVGAMTTTMIHRPVPSVPVFPRDSAAVAPMFIPNPRWREAGAAGP